MENNVPKSIFDLKQASTAAPVTDWNSVPNNFSLDSLKLRRYVIEDVMFADPQVHKHILLLVSINHPAFATTWLTIYREQSLSDHALAQAPITIYKEMFFQLEACVVKNPAQQAFIDGIHNKEHVKYLLLYKGGAGLGLHFPGCSCQKDIELKFASVLHETDSLMVWGTNKACCNNTTLFVNLGSSQAKKRSIPIFWWNYMGIILSLYFYLQTASCIVEKLNLQMTRQ